MGVAPQWRCGIRTNFFPGSGLVSCQALTISPYEMMFGVPMWLPTELEDSDIPKNATTKELSKIMAEPLSGKDGKLIFDSVDKNPSNYSQLCIWQYFQSKNKTIVLL